MPGGGWWQCWETEVRGTMLTWTPSPGGAQTHPRVVRVSPGAGCVHAWGFLLAPDCHFYLRLSCLLCPAETFQDHGGCCFLERSVCIGRREPRWVWRRQHLVLTWEHYFLMVVREVTTQVNQAGCWGANILDMFIHACIYDCKRFSILQMFVTNKLLQINK